MARKAIIRILMKIPWCRCLMDYRKIRQFRFLNEDEKRCVEFYRQFIKAGDLVFDVGANMGSRTKVFLSLGARVVAFEPQKVCRDFLRLVLKEEPNVTLVEAALSGKEGEAEMLISDMTGISTLSKQWVKATKESGRFRQFEWNQKQHVYLTTLDKAVQRFGAPSFVKIDVEGYEFEVLSGLTKPIQFLSIEYAAENMENTIKCIEYISSLSDVVFQYSAGESMCFHLPGWVSKTEIKDILAKTSARDALAWGDVYMRSVCKNS